MAVSWEEIEKSQAYQNASPEDRELTKNNFNSPNKVIVQNPIIAPENKMQAIGIDQDTKDSMIKSHGGDFLTGANRGLQNLEAMGYGATALAGEGLQRIGLDSIGQKAKDIGIEGYQRNIKEAAQYPSRYSFKDVYTGKAGISGTIDWIWGAAGELVPSMVEAAGGAALGAAVGTAAEPGGGTVIGAAAGSVASRTLLKKFIDKGVKQALKKGIGNLTEKEVRKDITKQALKKFGAKAGLGMAVLPVESGGMYADLLTTKGVNAPGTAMLFGTLSTAMEYAGGNAKLVDTFIDAFSKGNTSLIKKSAKELLTNIPEEALQEGGQEVMGILNTVVNTDEKLLTLDNLESTVEAMGYGIVGGGTGALVNTGLNVQDTNNSYASKLENKFSAITSHGIKQIPKSIDALDQKIIQNNKIMQDEKALTDLAEKSGYEITDFKNILATQNEFNQELKDRLQAELENPGQQGANEENKNVDLETLIAQQQEADTAKQVEQAKQVKEIDTKIQQTQVIFDQITDPIQKNFVGDQLKELQLKKDTLLNNTENIDTKDLANSLLKQFSETPAQATDQITDQTQEEILDSQRRFELLKENSLIESDRLAQENVNLYNSVLQKVRTNQKETFTPEETAFFEEYNNAKTNEKNQLEQQRNREKLLKDEVEALNNYAPTLLQNETSSFKDEQKVLSQEEINAAKQVVPLQEIEAKLTINEQQLAAIDNQLINTTDPNERIALQQEMAPLLIENAKLQNQWNEQYQNQATDPEPNAEFQINNKNTNDKLSLNDIQSMFPRQEVIQADDGTINVKFKNGKGVTFKSIQDAEQDFIKIAIETGQMSKNGKILGITVGNDVLLDANYADNTTMWHENKHVLDNLGMITDADNAALNREFNKLRKAGKLKFDLSKHKDPVQRMKENRANMFAQIMTDRASYSDTAFKQMIQRIIDFFDQIYNYGQQTVNSLAREVESGKLYERQPDQVSQFDGTMFKAQNDSMAAQALTGQLKKTNINTPEFNQWFDQSIAKKADGSPMELYHGTDQVFETFNKDEETNTNHATSSLGHFFTANKKIANKYGQHTLPVYLKMNNPYKMSLQEAQSMKSTTESAQRQEELRDAGYDSVIIETGADPYIVVFDSGQVKSVYNQGEFKSPENIYFQTQDKVNELNEQKLPDAEYAESFKEKNNTIQSILQTMRIKGTEAKQLADKLLTPISTRLKNINPNNPLLRDKMRRLDFDIQQRIIEYLKVAQPLLEKTKKTSIFDSREKMSPADVHAWDLARKQGDTVKINQIADRYGLREQQEKLREVLNKIRKEAQDVGYDVGFIDEYWPRIIKDTEGFLQATQGISNRPDFTEALKEKAKKMGITFEELNENFTDVKADVISNMILNQSAGIGGPGNIQGRVYDTIPKGLEKYYMNSDAALMQYIYSMTKKIEARKFFGKVPPKIQGHKKALAKAQTELNRIVPLTEQEQENVEVADVLQKRITDLEDQIERHTTELNKYKNQRDYTENIGAYIDELIINGDLRKDDEKTVRNILNARFNEHGTTGVVNTFKNMSYIDVMGNPISALTQIGDLAWAAYVGKAWTPKGFKNTTKNMINAALNKSNMTKEDLGLERIAQEFADGTTLGNAVSKVFNAVGLTKMDSIGKETLINNALMNYQDQIKTIEGRKALEKQIRHIFGNETRKVIEDLSTDTHSDNVKLLIYSKLLDFQPAALSEMPEAYLNGGNGRVFYMLKTYTIKQMDVFRNEIFHELKSGDPQRIKQGLQNMVGLVSMLTLANAGADELKDLVLGKEVSFKDNVIDNFLTMGGVSRYKRMQITRDGLGTALAKQILPPFKFVNAAWSDVSEKVNTGELSKGVRSLDSVPLFGKLAYWHYGRGSKLKKPLVEKEFLKEGRKFTKFKKQFEKATDKAMFLQANAEEFKKMKLYQNFKKSVNKNKSDINALKKLEQTPGVIQRLGELEKQRKLFYDRYFSVVKNL